MRAALRPKESDIQATIRDYLRMTGWFVIRHHQTLGSHKGLSDLSAVKGGRVLWIEVKTPRGRQSKHQRQFQLDIEAHGGEYLLARDVDDVIKCLRLEGGQNDKNRA